MGSLTTESVNARAAAELSQYPERPGVYKMLSAEGVVLYVGKALNLRKRVAQYFQKDLPLKTRIFMQAVQRVEYTITPSEWDALLLESTLIKAHRPKYNILLKDDKTYPYLLLNRRSDFPKFEFYRGLRRDQGDYFGPYPNAHSVRFALDWLQKVFLLRSCSDTFFSGRARPCLQHQMKRCSAPCVGYISKENYQDSVKQAVLFLKGKNQELLKQLKTEMEQASLQWAFEKAAVLRDQIERLKALQEKQSVVHEQGDLDVFAYVQSEHLKGRSVLSRLSVRGGLVLGHRHYFLDESCRLDEEKSGTQWMVQCFTEHEIWPELILVSPSESIWDLSEWTLFSEQGSRVRMRYVRGDTEKRLYEMALENAKDVLIQRVKKLGRYLEAAQALQSDLQLDLLPQTMVCFDVSHFQGEATVVSSVVFDLGGPKRRDYRRYTVHPVQGGDDYEALHLAFTRYAQSVRDGKREWPDVVVVDGGLGQYRVFQRILSEHGAAIPLLAISKGPERKSGEEDLFYSRSAGDPQPITLAADAFLWIQAIRDEAHRFAITGHRRKLSQARFVSPLDQIPGLGKVKKKRLLQQLGGLAGVKAASIEALAAVPGIGPTLGALIYAAWQDRN